MNTLDKPIELSVSFPIDEDISLIKFTIIVDEKVYISKVMEKVKAEEKYFDVIASGNAGFISNYDEELKSYSNSIGNIGPKQKIKLISSFIQMIGAKDMSYEFKLIDNYPYFNIDKQSETMP